MAVFYAVSIIAKNIVLIVPSLSYVVVMATFLFYDIYKLKSSNQSDLNTFIHLIGNSTTLILIAVAFVFSILTYLSKKLLFDKNDSLLTAIGPKEAGHKESSREYRNKFTCPATSSVNLNEEIDQALFKDTVSTKEKVAFNLSEQSSCFIDKKDRIVSTEEVFFENNPTSKTEEIDLSNKMPAVSREVIYQKIYVEKNEEKILLMEKEIINIKDNLQIFIDKMTRLFELLSVAITK